MWVKGMKLRDYDWKKKPREKAESRGVGEDIPVTPAGNHEKPSDEPPKKLAKKEAKKQKEMVECISCFDSIGAKRSEHLRRRRCRGAGHSQAG